MPSFVGNNFLCDKTNCIPHNWVCDLHKDCKDGTDEDPQNCIKTPCQEHEFQCQLSKNCIPSVWKCDLSHDCGPNDFSDESDCGEFLTIICFIFLRGRELHCTTN